MNPVMTIAGIVNASPDNTHWRTPMHNPDGLNSRMPPLGGPVMSMAGAAWSTPTAQQWSTPYPNGEAIYVNALRIAEAKAAREVEQAKVLALPRPASRRRARPEAKAA
jgi:hypothetical protein